MRILIGITGASGVILGVRLVEELEHSGVDIHVVVSSAGYEVAGWELKKELVFSDAVTVHDENDPFSPLNSGSFILDTMVVVPCTLKTLAAIASGFADNLIVRSAVNTLRFGKRLIVVPRETPLPMSALENMLSLKKDGAIILPPMLAYYHHPENCDDFTNYIVGRILDVIGLEHSLYKGWGKESQNRNS